MMKASRLTDARKAFILKQGADGHMVAEICRKAGFSEATYFNWKKKYEGLLPDEMRLIKQLEDENTKLKRLVADLDLDKPRVKERTGRSVRLLELDPKYVDGIVERWQNLTGGVAVLDGEDRTFNDMKAIRANADAA